MKLLPVISIIITCLLLIGCNNEHDKYIDSKFLFAKKQLMQNLQSYVYGEDKYQAAYFKYQYRDIKNKQSEFSWNVYSHSRFGKSVGSGFSRRYKETRIYAEYKYSVDFKDLLYPTKIEYLDSDNYEIKLTCDFSNCIQSLGENIVVHENAISSSEMEERFKEHLMKKRFNKNRKNPLETGKSSEITLRVKKAELSKVKDALDYLIRKSGGKKR